MLAAWGGVLEGRVLLAASQPQSPSGHALSGLRKVSVGRVPHSLADGGHPLPVGGVPSEKGQRPCLHPSRPPLVALEGLHVCTLCIRVQRHWWRYGKAP